MSIRTCVYRAYDADGTLLYVGCSSRPAGRLSQHKISSAWYREMAGIREEWFDTRDEALRAETRAIYTESPLHNVNGVPKPAASAGTYAERAAHALRLAIGEAGLPLTQVSERSGLPYASLHRCLNSRPDRLDVQIVETIAKAIGIQPEDIMRGVPA